MGVFVSMNLNDSSEATVAVLGAYSVYMKTILEVSIQQAVLWGKGQGRRAPTWETYLRIASSKK